MEKYTPGPWYIRDTQNHLWLVENTTRVIAKVGGTRDQEEIKANAQLLAAAPDMLEALKVAEKELSGRKGKFGLGVVRGAIKKANGE